MKVLYYGKHSTSTSNIEDEIIGMSTSKTKCTNIS